MTRALEDIAANGFGDAISPEALATLSPYQTEHINRFGDYVLDLSMPPAPLPFTLPRRQRTRRQTAAAVLCEDLARILAIARVRKEPRAKGVLPATPILPGSPWLVPAVALTSEAVRIGVQRVIDRCPKLLRILSVLIG